MSDFFRKFARSVSGFCGHPTAFVLAFLTILIWAITGPLFDFSDTWQLVINTGTTIITFLMVFIIQNTQNRDGMAMQLKLDELIRANSKARNKMIDLEELSDQELEQTHKDLCALRDDNDRRIEEVVRQKKNRS